MEGILNHRIYQNILARINEARARNANAFSAALVQPGYLQLEIALAQGKNIYQFGVNQTDTLPQQRPSEIRLNNNDAFVITETALFYKNENPNNAGQGHLASYINSTEFPAEANYFSPTDLDAAGFNSYLSIKVGDVVFTNNEDMRPSRYVRTTQQNAADNYSEQLGFDGYFQQEPIVTLDGSKKNQLALTLPNWAGQLIQYSANHATQIYAVLKFRGFLITNGSGLGVLNYQ